MKILTTINAISKPLHMITGYLKSFHVHHATGSVAVRTVMQYCVMNGSRQTFVGKWYYMDAYIWTSMCSIPLTTVVSVWDIYS